MFKQLFCLIWLLYCFNFASIFHWLIYFGFILFCHCTNFKVVLFDALRDLVPFVSFKNRENTHEGVLLLWVSFMFFKLWKSYQIGQSTTSDTQRPIVLDWDDTYNSDSRFYRYLNHWYKVAQIAFFKFCLTTLTAG